MGWVSPVLAPLQIGESWQDWFNKIKLNKAAQKTTIKQKCKQWNLHSWKRKANFSELVWRNIIAIIISKLLESLSNYKHMVVSHISVFGSKHFFTPTQSVPSSGNISSVGGIRNSDKNMHNRVWICLHQLESGRRAKAATCFEPGELRPLPDSLIKIENNNTQPLGTNKPSETLKTSRPDWSL